MQLKWSPHFNGKSANAYSRLYYHLSGACNNSNHYSYFFFSSFIFPFFFTAIPTEAARQSRNVAIVVTKHGGHIAFLEGLLPRHNSYMDQVFAQYVDAIFKHGDVCRELSWSLSSLVKKLHNGQCSGMMGLLSRKTPNYHNWILKLR